MPNPEDQYHEAQEQQWHLLICEAGNPAADRCEVPPYIIIHAPEYEDNGSGINPEW